MIDPKIEVEGWGPVPPGSLDSAAHAEYIWAFLNSKKFDTKF